MGQATPKGLRLHISIFGRRNVGKSSLLNRLIGQEISIVSDTAGTTTDPVEKAMELLPFGPVLFVDTAGIDDTGALGQERIRKTRAILNRTDFALLCAENGQWGPFEKQLREQFEELKIPYLIVFNKSDLNRHSFTLPPELKASQVVRVSALTGEGIGLLKEKMIQRLPADFWNGVSIVSDLVPPGQTCVLVVPIDKEAPKGRLILPQVQTIRELLDNDCLCLVVKERELPLALRNLNQPPALVVTDSQAFLKVSADVPPKVKMTSFSILFARYKGDLRVLVEGTQAIDNLRPGDRILIAEACTHHAITDDIGRVKIPRWLRQYVGGALVIDHVSGHDFPDSREKLQKYRLVIHCGACMLNRREMLTRITATQEAGVPITNYGLTIAYSLGIFERALEPFPFAKEEIKKHTVHETVKEAIGR